MKHSGIVSYYVSGSGDVNTQFIVDFEHKDAKDTLVNLICGELTLTKTNNLTHTEYVEFLDKHLGLTLTRLSFNLIDTLISLRNDNDDVELCNEILTNSSNINFDDGEVIKVIGVATPPLLCISEFSVEVL